MCIRDRYMVAGEFVAGVLLAAIEAAVIVPAKQGAVAQWRGRRLYTSYSGGDGARGGIGVVGAM